MKTVLDLFDYKTGSLPALENTDEGNIPLVYGTTQNNGIIKFVKANKEQIFEPPLITVSYLGTAFVQILPFTTSVVDKSNIIILKPKNKMSLEELYFHAVQINRVARFGFHYGRRMNMGQLDRLKLLPFKKTKAIDFKKILPKTSKHKQMEFDNTNTKFEFKRIDKFFEIKRGKGAYLETLEKGKTPLISATLFNNGVVDYVDFESTFKAPAITVERVKGQAFVQLDDFATVPDDISILIPKRDFPLSFFFYVSAMINSEKWRYSYSRKLSLNRLNNLKIRIPFEHDKPYFRLIDNQVDNCYGWNDIISYFTN